MAGVCESRRALMEIPAPQPKIAAQMRRSYQEILGARLAPSPLPRGKNATTKTKPVQSLDNGRIWSGGLEEQCEKIDEHHASLSKQQLVQLFRSLILVEQVSTLLFSHDRSHEPMTLASDLKYLQEDLQLKKANVYRSIPYSRFGSNRDAHCYRKAFPYLVAFNVSCEEWGQVLLRNKEWDAVLEHTLMALRYTSELPQWDTANHNVLREQCFSILAAHSLSALQHYHPEPNRLRELLRRFKVAQLHSQSIVPCIQELQRIMGCADDSSMDTKYQEKQTNLLAASQ